MSDTSQPGEAAATTSFDLAKYRAERAARPLAVHKAELIEELRKCLLGYGLEHTPLDNLRVTLFADACVTIADHGFGEMAASDAGRIWYRPEGDA
jgi:hypothetical protein